MSTSNVCSQKVQVGFRKEIFPDFHPYNFFNGGLRNLYSNRRVYMPESEILILQDSYQTDFSSLCYCPDRNTSSPPCFRCPSPETKHHYQLASLTSCHGGDSARTLTYPNNQGELGIAPVFCALAQSDLSCNHSGKVFMQTHL